MLSFLRNIFLFALFLTAFNASAQTTTDSLLKDAPNVYLDCNFCATQYLRQNITFVNYVRDRMVADVHVLATRQNTGSGGQEYTFQFIGQGRFEGMSDTLTITTSPNATTDEIREARARIIKIGLLRFLAQTPLASQVDVSFEVPTEPTAIEDKWNNWVYEISTGSWFNKEAAYESFNNWTDFNADRVTPEWKLEFSAGWNYNQSKFDLGDETLTNIQRSQYFYSGNIKSINSHWSYGAFGNARSSVFDNLQLLAGFRPAIEYNLFPYEESTRRQLRINLRSGYEYRQYNDTTIYDKIEEGLWETSLSVSYRVQEKWGNVSASVSSAAFMHDLSKNELRVWLSTNLRLFKGFSFRVSGNGALIRNQLGLIKGEASEEDILLRQRQIATNYRFWGNVGFTYTFGSIYNSVVNPRFGG